MLRTLVRDKANLVAESADWLRSMEESLGLSTGEHNARLFLPGLDEVDRVFESPVHSDFFGMIRSLHDSRARLGHLARLDLVLVTSTDPEHFIRTFSKSLNQTCSASDGTVIAPQFHFSR